MKKRKKILIMLMMFISIMTVAVFMGKDMTATEDKIVDVVFENTNITEESINIHAVAKCLEGYKITAMQIDEQPYVEDVTELSFTATENKDYTVKVYYQSLTDQKELIETFTTTVDSLSNQDKVTSLINDESSVKSNSENDFIVNDKGIITQYVGSKTITELIIPGKIGDISVTGIGNDVFVFCTSLKSVIIAGSVTSIGDYAFGSCTSLTSIEIPNSVISIGEYAFVNCGLLASLEIPDSVTSIGNYAFYRCHSLKTITIPSSVTCIGSFTFLECESLISIEIPSSITSIGEKTFGFCSGLASIKIPNSVTSIGKSAFYRCNSLTSIIIPDSVISIEEDAFEFCTGLASIKIPDSVISIGRSAFDNCTSLTSVTISSSVTSIGNDTFRNCSSLTSVTIPSSVTSIGEYAFQGCKLTSLRIPNSVTSIGDYSFSMCKSLTSVILPSSVTTIESGVFSTCSSLTSVTIPSSITSIGGLAFQGCSSLTEITIPNSVTSIGGLAFQGCSSLTEITIPNSVTSIGNYTFRNCSSLKSFTIPTSVIDIGGYLFKGCTALTSLTIPNSLKSIGKSICDGAPITDLLIMIDNPEQVNIPETSPILSIENIDKMNVCRATVTGNIEMSSNDIKYHKGIDKLFLLDDIFMDKGITEIIYTGTSGTNIYIGDDISIPENYLELDESIDTSIQYELMSNPTSSETKIVGNQLFIGKDEKSTDLRIKATCLSNAVELPIIMIPYQSLSIKTKPLNTYIDGEMYNPEGLEVTLTYEDGRKEDIRYDENQDDFSFQYDRLDLTTTKQMITYKELTVEHELIITQRFEEKILNSKDSNIKIKGEFTNESYIIVEKVKESDNELYMDLEDKNILGNYEVKVIGKYQGKLFIVFDVGEENNGKKAYIRHLKQDGTIDEYEETVLAGKVGITVSELSPFVIYVEKGINNEPNIDINDGMYNGSLPSPDKPVIIPKMDTETGENQIVKLNKLPEDVHKTTNTGDIQTFIPYIIIGGISLIGIGFSLFKRKQRE